MVSQITQLTAHLLRIEIQYKLPLYRLAWSQHYSRVVVLAHTTMMHRA